jgi:hypothetical protein
MKLRVVGILCVVVGSGVFSTSAAATPVASNDASYSALGRVFPDPIAGCADGAPGCDPNAQGNVPATQFIQYQEFVDALGYMNSNREWSKYMEVEVLDGKIGANGPGEAVPDADLGVGSPGDAVFEGNDLPLEYDPKPEYKSAGLPTTSLGRESADMIVVRVTDESVPDADKKRYALSLSIHGIERAGVEGGTRAMEDLVTAATTGRSNDPVVPANPDVPGSQNGPSFADVLKRTIIYFTYPNPDGWRRGSVTEGGVFFQRYNGNGVDVNRDWPDIGFSFRPYSGLSEPESRALSGYLGDVEGNAGQLAAGDDLHGQPEADALSFTLLPHGSHNFEKDQRIRQTAIAIHNASERALLWSPLIQPNDAPPPGCTPSPPVVGAPTGDPCFPIYGQTWGTVYDTINYTTTGALGDYFDSSIGVGADGIDNEMSFSHLDKNITFEPQTEQLHVAGNKALIFAHLAQLAQPSIYRFVPAGTQAYVPGVRLKRDAKDFQAGAPEGSVAQADVSDTGTLGPDGTVVVPFTVKRGPQPADGSPDAGKNVFNGGMRVDATATNIQGISSGSAAMAIQCRGCDQHPGDKDTDDWVTVSEDYNQSPLYAQAGITVAVNRPQAFKADGTPVEWRAVISGSALGVGLPISPTVVANVDVHFTRDRATTDGATGGDNPAQLAAYDVANTDFFDQLNQFIDDDAQKFQKLDPRAVIAGQQSLSGIRSLVLADDPLPGYTGDYAATSQPSGGPTADQPINSAGGTFPGAGSQAPGTTEEFPFTIGPNDENSKVDVAISWASANDDFDLYLYKVEENGDRTEVASSASVGGTGNTEQLTLADPGAGDYVVVVDNYAAAPPAAFTGTIDFTGAAAGEEAGTGAYTVAEKDAWLAALRQYVEGGGNLVLTDGALQALPGLTQGLATPIPDGAVRRETVYVGQMTFDRSDADGDETVGDPLAKDIDQQGARFNSGERRQTFEPTPLGFAIQDESGSDESNARQYDVDLAAWEAAGGRTAATSADSGDRDAAPVYTRTTLGELALGNGHVRIAGALLPQPSEEFDHPLGLEPFATTYTGYILVCNLLDCTVSSKAAPGGAPPADGGGGGNDGPGAGGACDNVFIGTKVGDKLSGTDESDKIKGKSGRDKLNGKGGDDCMNGGAGKDRVKGGPGNDDIRGGRGKDKLRGNTGRDVFHAARGGRDRIDCGPGKDKAFIDKRRDRARHCEKIRRR